MKYRILTHALAAFIGALSVFFLNSGKFNANDPPNKAPQSLDFEQIGLQEISIKVESINGTVISGVTIKPPITAIKPKTYSKPVKLALCTYYEVSRPIDLIPGDEIDCLICERTEQGQFPESIWLVGQLMRWEKIAEIPGRNQVDDSIKFDYYVVLMRKHEQLPGDIPYLGRLFQEKKTSD